MASEWRTYSIREIGKGLIDYEQKVGKLNPKAAAWVSKNWYPFHQRANHPYQIWCSEITVLKTFLSLGSPASLYRDWRAGEKVVFTKKPKPAVERKPRVYQECEGQLSLFDLLNPPE